MPSKKILHFLNLLREFDLDAINEAAERRFTLLVAGQSDPDALSLAQALSGTAEIHPWIEVKTLPLEATLPSYTTAILITSNHILESAEREARAQLQAATIPLVIVALGAPYAGAALPRRDEAARVRLPSTADREAFQTVLAPALLDANPGLELALARHLAGLRPVVAERLIEDTARANAGYAFTTGLAETVPLMNVPLNVADVVILTKNQLLMTYKVALALGKQGHPRALMTEIIGVLGGGLFFRQIARQLVGLIPGIGIPAKVAVAYAGTWVIGHAIYTWGTSDVALSAEELGDLMQEAAARGREVATELIRRARPNGSPIEILRRRRTD